MALIVYWCNDFSLVFSLTCTSIRLTLSIVLIVCHSFYAIQFNSTSYFYTYYDVNDSIHRKTKTYTMSVYGGLKGIHSLYDEHL